MTGAEQADDLLLVQSLQQMFQEADRSTVERAVRDANRGLRTAGLAQSRSADACAHMVAERLLRLRLRLP